MWILFKIVLTFTLKLGHIKNPCEAQVGIGILKFSPSRGCIASCFLRIEKSRHLLLSYSRVLRNRGDQPIHILKAWTHFPWDQCMVCLHSFTRKKLYIYIYIHLQIYGIFTYIIVNTYMQNTMDPRSLQKGQPPPKIGDERTSDSAMKKNYTSDWAWLDDFNMVQLTKRFRYLYIGHPWNLT